MRRSNLCSICGLYLIIWPKTCQMIGHRPHDFMVENRYNFMVEEAEIYLDQQILLLACFMFENKSMTRAFVSKEVFGDEISDYQNVTT